MQEVVLKTTSCRRKGRGRAKIGSCVFHSSLLLYEKGPDENVFSSGPLLYRRYAYPAERQVSYFCNIISFLPYFFGKESLFSCFVLPLKLSLPLLYPEQYSK